MELPDASHEIVNLLMEVVYNGVVEATIDELRELILLAHRLYIAIPLSDDILQGLDLELPTMPPLVNRGPPKLKQRPTFMTTSMSASAPPKPKLLPPKPQALKPQGLNREFFKLQALKPQALKPQGLKPPVPLDLDKDEPVGKIFSDMRPSFTSVESLVLAQW